ncbi:uncharacterized protein LOC105843575 isoform X1 [Hydra vulgaris]|uniref:uncharacterized protein LOC105843575 isoform X1 n=1 Tax=Hydra vulgaris TaxID=6087 RepID=UPI001F5E5713|nr:uncharacterized protein LOC105843575 isoform X1 [Hydra vulgaris]XP_047134603.1 uncharacterized protein LOC105843575 isoform X1 [Hydra vulgaris]
MLSEIKERYPQYFAFIENSKVILFDVSRSCLPETTNQSVYQNFVVNKSFSWQGVIEKEKPVIMLHDPVHLFKSIRNNWFTEKTQTISLKINNQPLSGDWSHIVQLYNRQKTCVAKTTKLSRKSVYPSLIDRQNVANMVAVFNEKTVAALRLVNFENTACFLAPIVSLWNMLNVKRKGCDVLLNDINRSPFQTLDDLRFKVILAFADATSKMSEGKGLKRHNTFTPETKHALVNTLQGLIELIKKLLSEDFLTYISLLMPFFLTIAVLTII